MSPTVERRLSCVGDGRDQTHATRLKKRRVYAAYANWPAGAVYILLSWYIIKWIQPTISKREEMKNLKKDSMSIDNDI